MDKPKLTDFETFSRQFIQRYERYLPTAFDESLTLLEKMNKTIEQLNMLGLLTNDLVTEWNKVMQWILNDGLTDDIRKKIDEMVKNGVLKELLNESLFNDLNNKLNALELEKMDRGELIYPSNLSSEVRNMMTGGSVAIVGDNAVGTNELQNNAVTRNKINFYSNNKSKNLFDKTLTTKGGYFRSTDGTWISNASYQSTDYIKVNQAETYYIKNIIGTNRYITCFDAAKNFVVGYFATQVVIPDGVEYIRVSVSNAEVNQLMITTDENATYETPKYEDEFLSVTDKNLSKDVLNGFDYKTGKLVTTGVYKQAIVFDNENELITINPDVYVFTSDNAYLNKDTFVFDYPTKKFGNSSHGFLIYNIQDEIFDLIDFVEFRNRKLDANIIYLGLFQDVTFYSTIEAIEGYQLADGKMISLTNNQSQMTPLIDYTEKNVIIPANSWYMYSVNMYKLLNTESDIIIPYTSSYGFLCFDFNTDTFSIETAPVSIRGQKSQITKIVIGFFNATNRTVTWNGQIKNAHYPYASILGDSISTYEGWIPEENRTWYTPENFSNVKYTWWYEIMHSIYRLCVNNSWSGSRITNTRADGEASDALKRTDKLHKVIDGVTVNPEFVFLYLGTNDLVNNVSLGTFNGVINDEDDQTFKNTYARVLKSIYENYPGVVVYCMTISHVPAKEGQYIYVNNNNDSIVDFNNAIKEVAAYFNTKVIDLKDSGINRYNQSKFGGTHPGGYGHKRITLNVRKNINESEY